MFSLGKNESYHEQHNTMNNSYILQLLRKSIFTEGLIKENTIK